MKKAIPVIHSLILIVCGCYNNVSMKRTIPVVAILTIITALTVSTISYAQPYGKGLYNENVGYGSETSLTISTDGPVIIPTITPTESGALGTGNSTITITSTDVTGYKLYISALSSTSMNNLGTPLPTATFSVPSATKNVWGYNTTQSATNFTAISLTNTQIDSMSVPTTGHNTIVTYGLYLDFGKPAGQYQAQVVYTAVPQTN